MSVARWIEGAIPLVFAAFWVGVYAFLVLAAGREKVADVKAADLHFLVFLAIDRAAEGSRWRSGSGSPTGGSS